MPTPFVVVGEREFRGQHRQQFGLRGASFVAGRCQRGFEQRDPLFVDRTGAAGPAAVVRERGADHFIAQSEFVGRSPRREQGLTMGAVTGLA